MQGVRGIVFDLDDTLYPQADFKRSGFAAVSEWAAEELDLGKSICLRELNRIMAEKSPSYPYMFNELADRLGLDKTEVSKMVRVFIDHKPAIECYPGAIRLLVELKEKFKTGILTDGRHSVQKNKLSALGLTTIVDAVLCSDSLGMEKPDEKLFAWFEGNFGLTGPQMAYVGDNPKKDFIGAKNRGWKTVRVLTGEHAERQVCADCDAHTSVSSVIHISRELELYKP